MLTKEQLLAVINDTVPDWKTDKIDELYQALYKEEIELAFANAILPLWNNEGERKTILSIFMSTQGTYQEKMDFVQVLGKTEFILKDEIFKDKKIQPILKWFNGSDFAQRAFINLCHLAGSSVGPGEIALTIFCPSSEHTGRSAEAGDITIFGKKLEVKAKVTSSSPGGRLHDSTKADYDWTKCKELFSKLLKENVTGLSLARYIDKIRDTLTLDQKQEVASTIIEANFAHVDHSATSTLHQYLTDGTKDQIKHEWAFLGFENYKAYAKFDGVLFLDVYNRISIYTEDIRQIADMVSVKSVHLFGNQREAMPQVTVKIT